MATATFPRQQFPWSLDMAALALAAWSIAAAPEPAGRRLSVREVQALLARTRQADYVGLDYPKLPRQP